MLRPAAARSASTASPMSSPSNQNRFVFDADFSVDFAHRLIFTEDLLADGDSTLESIFATSSASSDSGILVAIDSEVARLHSNLGERLTDRFSSPDLPELREVTIVPGGEAAKNDPDVVEHLLSLIDTLRIDRKSTILCVGGGAVLDAVGYAAGIAHRGVRLVRVPTTVLSQLDAAVGVKNGVNKFGKKNFCGTFAVPDAVLCDESMLATLSDRDWRSGFSEAVKIACLKDESFFDDIESSAPRIRDRNMDAARPVIRHCADLHLRHIAEGGDPFECREARPLDFGHWSAHRLESITDFTVTHGEAVSIGIALDTHYSHLVGRIDRDSAIRVVRTLDALGLPTSHSALGSDALLDGLEEFREHLGGRLTITLLEGIGRGIDVHEVDRSLVVEAATTLPDLLSD